MTSDVAYWQRVSVGGAARDALALIEEDLRQTQYAADQKAYAAILAGRLTPEMALSLFYEKHATYTLQKRLLQQAKQGETAAMHLEDRANG